MSQIDNEEDLLEVPADSSNVTEKRIDEKPFDESSFFATGHFSIHHQPSDDSDVFMGE